MKAQHQQMKSRLKKSPSQDDYDRLFREHQFALKVAIDAVKESAQLREELFALKQQELKRTAKVFQMKASPIARCHFLVTGIVKPLFHSSNN